MKITKLILALFTFVLSIQSKGFAQNNDVYIPGNSPKKIKKPFDGNRWRAGLTIQYSSSFKNINLGNNIILGGFTGKGLNLFGGYKIHKYLALELETGLLINNYNQSFNTGEVIIARFNKFYANPTVKFIYPIVKREYKTINIYLGGGIGLNGSGRFYLEDRYGSYKDVIYAKYDPMAAPFFVIGTELLFGSSNIVAGFKYLDGSFNANKYSVSYDPLANLKNAPTEVKRISAQGLGISVGFIQEF